MTISINFNTIPAILQIDAVPGVSVADISKPQVIFNTSDVNATSTGLYIWKSGAFGAQNWLRFASTQEVSSLMTRTATYPTRSLNSAFQPSSTKDSLVSYSVDIACTLSLTGGMTGTVFLEICATSGFSSGVQELGRSVNGNTGTLTIGLNITQNITGTLSGFVPAGYYARIRTANTTGAPTFNFRSGQEVTI